MSESDDRLAGCSRPMARRLSRGAAAALIAVSAAGVGAVTAPAVGSMQFFGSVDLVATQAAITMNGTFTPDVTPQFQAAVLDAYILPLVGPDYTGVPLRTPQDLWPLSGVTALTYNNSTRVGYQILSDKYDEIVDRNAADGEPNTPMVVFGYSQSAFIASMFDERLAEVRAGGGTVPPTTFVQVGNTNIPNGGLMARFNGLGLTPWTPLVFAPTKTGNTTYEVFRQYDPFADFPKYTLNALAVVNSLMGYLLHFTLPVSGSAPWLKPVIDILNVLITPISLNPASPDYVEPIVSRYEDTVYQFVPTTKLPILSPLYIVGLSGLADALDPVVRPLIEAGYDRSVSFGVPTPAEFGLGPGFGPALQESWQAVRQLLTPRPAASVALNAGPPALPAGAEPAPLNDVAPAPEESKRPERVPDSPDSSALPTPPAMEDDETAAVGINENAAADRDEDGASATPRRSRQPVAATGGSSSEGTGSRVPRGRG